MMKRQGDLLIVKVSKIPDGVVKKTSLVLAEGEATGHMHKLDCGEVYEKDEVLYFRVTDNHQSTLMHPEHKAIIFEPGEYKVVQQREYTPEGWRAVID